MLPMGLINPIRTLPILNRAQSDVCPTGGKINVQWIRGLKLNGESQHNFLLDCERMQLFLFNLPGREGRREMVSNGWPVLNRSWKRLEFAN